jgi:hypothetical protein
VKSYSLVTISLKSNEFHSKSYEKIGAISYEGSNNFPVISKINVVGYMDSDETDYSVRVYDKTNSLIIAESTYTNTKEDILEVKPISNIPSEQSIIEVHVKSTKGKKKAPVYIESVEIYFN